MFQASFGNWPFSGYLNIYFYSVLQIFVAEALCLE